MRWENVRDTLDDNKVFLLNLFTASSSIFFSTFLVHQHRLTIAQQAAFGDVSINYTKHASICHM